MVILEILEWLSRYGIIDLVFGIGIFTFISKALKSKIKTRLNGVTLLPEIDVNRNAFILTFKNQSNLPLYLYQGFIKPGYSTESIDRTTWKSFLKTLIFMTYKNDVFPKTNIPKSTDGLYILQVESEDENTSPTLFIDPFKYKYYKLDILAIHENYVENPNKIFEDKKFGKLIIMYVHGTESGQLEVQL